MYQASIFNLTYTGKKNDEANFLSVTLSLEKRLIFISGIKTVIQICQHQAQPFFSGMFFRSRTGEDSGNAAVNTSSGHLSEGSVKSSFFNQSSSRRLAHQHCCPTQPRGMRELQHHLAQADSGLHEKRAAAPTGRGQTNRLQALSIESGEIGMHCSEGTLDPSWALTLLLHFIWQLPHCFHIDGCVCTGGESGVGVLCQEKARWANGGPAKPDDRRLALPGTSWSSGSAQGPGESDGELSLGQVAKGCGGFPFTLLPLRTTSPLLAGDTLSAVIIHVFGLSKIYHECYKMQNLKGSWKHHAKGKYTDIKDMYDMISLHEISRTGKPVDKI